MHILDFSNYYSTLVLVMSRGNFLRLASAAGRGRRHETNVEMETAQNLSARWPRRGTPRGCARGCQARNVDVQGMSYDSFSR